MSGPIVIDWETNVRWRWKRNEVCVAKCAAKGEELAYTCACHEKQRRCGRGNGHEVSPICTITWLYVSGKYILHIYDIHIHINSRRVHHRDWIVSVGLACDHRLQFISCRSIKYYYLTNLYQSYWFFLQYFSFSDTDLLHLKTTVKIVQSSRLVALTTVSYTDLATISVLCRPFRQSFSPLTRELCVPHVYTETSSLTSLFLMLNHL